MILLQPNRPYMFPLDSPRKSSAFEFLKFCAKLICHDNFTIGATQKQVLETAEISHNAFDKVGSSLSPGRPGYVKTNKQTFVYVLVHTFSYQFIMVIFVTI